jgi:Spy/CpxP family protein refolding chaperone
MMKGIALAVALTLSLTPAYAQMGGMEPLGATTLYTIIRPPMPGLPDEALECMTGPDFPFDDLKGNLMLTDAQHQQIYNIECQYLNKIEPLMAQLKASSRQLRNMMTAATVDAAKVRDLQTQINQQRDQIANLFLEQQIASVQALSADQRAALSVAKIKNHHSQSQHHWW